MQQRQGLCLRYYFSSASIPSILLFPMSLFLAIASAMPGYSIIDRGVQESSKDADDQSITNTLDDCETTFWSTTGEFNVIELLSLYYYLMLIPCAFLLPGSTNDYGEEDSLTYSLSPAFCSVHTVSILPFRAFFQQGMPVYAPREIRVLSSPTSLPP